MSRRPNPRADLLRQAVAEEAARIMREQGVDDFLLAKRKAAERLGVTDASILPRNTEIEAALVAHQRLFAADRHEADLAAMRRSALEAMRLMSDFQPRLVGPVLTGTASVFRPRALRAVAEERGKILPGVPGDVYDTVALTEDNELTIALKTLGALMISPSECTVVTEVMPTWRSRRVAVSAPRRCTSGSTSSSRPPELRRGIPAQAPISRA